jgi:hypothetical protein
MISFEMNFFSNMQTYVKVQIRLAVLKETFLNGLLQTFQLFVLSLEIGNYWWKSKTFVVYFLDCHPEKSEL